MLAAIEGAFQRASTKRILFIGEAITDEYVYVEPLYKPSKETILAVAEHSREKFVGGVQAAAKHLDGWCKTAIIDQPRPVHKMRYVQEGFNRKLFELYAHHKVRPVNLNGFPIADFDVVIVLDFGHGLINDTSRQALRQTKFLAVNAQTNAGNHGFNPVTKYKHADYVCVDYQEARLAVGDQWGPIADVIDQLCKCMGTDKVIVTEGRRGASWRGGHIAALETHPIDTLGAGDCFMAYTAPLIACGLPLPEAALVGCVAASMKTEIVGHQASVQPELVMQRVRHELSARDKRLTA